MTIFALFCKMLQGPGNTEVREVRKVGQKPNFGLKPIEINILKFLVWTYFSGLLEGVRGRRESRITTARASWHVSGVSLQRYPEESQTKRKAKEEDASCTALLH